MNLQNLHHTDQIPLISNWNCKIWHLENESCVKILSWIISHPQYKYSQSFIETLLLNPLTTHNVLVSATYGIILCIFSISLITTLHPTCIIYVVAFSETCTKPNKNSVWPLKQVIIQCVQSTPNKVWQISFCNSFIFMHIFANNHDNNNTIFGLNENS